MADEDDDLGDDESPRSEKAEAKFVLVPAGDPAYVTLGELVAAHHSTIEGAHIALVWAHDVKPDRDGHLVWGKTRKVTALERTFHPHDFIIALTYTVWTTLPDVAKRALLDHELEHCASRETDDGEVVYYVKKHDLEEFVSIVRRYGLWRTEVESFVNAALKREQKGLFDEAASSGAGEGTTPLPFPAPPEPEAESPELA